MSMRKNGTNKRILNEFVLSPFNFVNILIGNLLVYFSFIFIYYGRKLQRMFNYPYIRLVCVVAIRTKEYINVLKIFVILFAYSACMGGGAVIYLSLFLYLSVCLYEWMYLFLYVSINLCIYLSIYGVTVLSIIYISMYISNQSLSLFMYTSTFDKCQYVDLSLSFPLFLSLSFSIHLSI